MIEQEIAEKTEVGRIATKNTKIHKEEVIDLRFLRFFVFFVAI